MAAAILSGGSLSTAFQIKMKWEIESWEKKNPKNNDENQYKPQPQAISSIPRLFGIWSVEFVGGGKQENQIKKKKPWGKNANQHYVIPGLGMKPQSQWC